MVFITRSSVERDGDWFSEDEVSSHRIVINKLPLDADRRHLRDNEGEVYWTRRTRTVGVRPLDNRRGCLQTRAAVHFVWCSVAHIRRCVFCGDGLGEGPRTDTVRPDALVFTVWNFDLYCRSCWSDLLC